MFLLLGMKFNLAGGHVLKVARLEFTLLAAICFEIRQASSIPHLHPRFFGECGLIDSTWRRSANCSSRPQVFGGKDYETEKIRVQGADHTSAYVKSDGEWLAKCIVQGFFNAPIEALPEISVTDIVRASTAADVKLEL